MDLNKVTNLGQLFIEASNNYGERTILQWKSSSSKELDYSYEEMSGEELKSLVYRASRAIEQLGLKPFDKAAIISENRYEWVVTDFACILNKIVTVPIYTTITPEQIGYILRHSEAKVCFVSNELLVEKVRSAECGVQRIICFNKVENVSGNVIVFEEFLRERKDTHAKDLRLREINEDDLLTIIYTSGTTGIPKGVCLSHKNIISNLKSCHKAFRVDGNDIFLSFLPLAHSYERTAGYYFPISAGAKIVYAQSIETLAQQMSETKPTLVTAVPLLFNKMKTRVEKAIDGKSFKWVLRKIAFRKLRKRLGGKLRFFVSGGSALDKETGEFFDNAGIRILEGYGLTEASPVIAVNREDNYRFGTVGFPLDRVEVKIAEDGEILVKGDNVMIGYYKEPEETKKAITGGWLHTGDIGELDEDGRLKITDRKKTLYKTAGGKYISLTHIEDTISKSKYIDQIIAFGGDRSFVSALVVPDFEELKEAHPGHSGVTNEELIKNPEVLEFVEKEMNKAQSILAKYERVRRFSLLPKPFTIEAGELTPTLKIKRKIIEEKYIDKIEKMYEIR